MQHKQPFGVHEVRHCVCMSKTCRLDMQMQKEVHEGLTTPHSRLTPHASRLTPHVSLLTSSRHPPT